MSYQCSQPRQGGPGRQSQGRGRGGRGSSNRPTTRQPPASRFKDNNEKLAGRIFNCSNYGQADTFVKHS
jgi:hypothetical protein